MFKVVTTLLRLQVQLEATLHTLHTFCLLLSEVLKLVIMTAIMLSLMIKKIILLKTRCWTRPMKAFPVASSSPQAI